jgi:hypothetical protein
MKPSTPSDVSGDVESSASPGEYSIGASNRDLSEAATSLADPRSTSRNAPAGEGSIRYRIVALIAMLLLAVAAMVIWFYLRAN